MTFSIVARNGDACGVAVASRFLAAAAVVPGARAGAGAVASQAAANLRWVPGALALLSDGASAPETLTRLVADDPEQATRQAGVVDMAGAGATHTGEQCLPWAGSEHGHGVAVQGNCLTGPEVVAAMVQAWHRSAGEPFPRRLLATLTAGDRAGGDRRGRQSTGLLVSSPGGGYGGGSDVAVDLRVDDHGDPVGELARLLELHALYFGRPDPDTLLALSGPLAEQVQELVAAKGFASLAEWAGWENDEERLVDGAIDPLVLARLRAAGA